MAAGWAPPSRHLYGVTGTRYPRPAVHTASPLRAMLREAFRSAWATTPQFRQTKRARRARFLLSMWPHSKHCCKVWAGSTKTTGTPALRALETMRSASWAKDLGALLLELVPQVELTLAVPVQAAPGGLVAGGCGGDVGDAEIDANELVGLVLLGLGHVAGCGQVEHAAVFDQIGFALAALPQRLECIRGAGETDAFDASGEGPDRNGLRVVVPAQTPVVVRLRGLGPKDASARCPAPSPCTWTPTTTRTPPVLCSASAACMDASLTRGRRRPFRPVALARRTHSRLAERLSPSHPVLRASRHCR
ncbi:hypothetical protein M2283_008394 [Streptomyces pseudovenezuelae]|uniref:Uncharacterized protein n=1 Tax=Streptomyces pseudovenezuelae TaxID=67350 RepID=A0ABT6LXN9_9ACTN|nr:hypothetical protein [Streptomyces pseudovenezuelae]